MWNEDKQRLLDDLRRREPSGALSIDARELLDRLLHEVEGAESTALQPVLDHLRSEQRDLQAGISRLEQQNATLTDLVLSQLGSCAGTSLRLRPDGTDHSGCGRLGTTCRCKESRLRKH
jgi:hypothetical protein